jgi:hypothetical protein
VRQLRGAIVTQTGVVEKDMTRSKYLGCAYSKVRATVAQCQCIGTARSPLTVSDVKPSSSKKSMRRMRQEIYSHCRPNSSLIIQQVNKSAK